MKGILVLLIYIFGFVGLMAQPQCAVSVPFTDVESPKREVRAVWLTTLNGLDWPRTPTDGTARSIDLQKKELTDILDKLQVAGINTVLLQTRIRATTIYPSAEPWDKCLTGSAGVSPGYDPLAFAVEECHKRGMELHTWIVTIPVGKWNEKGCVEMRRKYPSLIKRIGDEGYMNPENPTTADILADICADITNRYDVDGIHLDYIRYPEKWKLTISKDRAREHITNIVRKINLRVKVLKPWVKVSCAPVGKYDDLPQQSSRGWNAYSRVCQDAQGWLRMGLMDELFPMMYFHDEQFFPFALDWQEHTYGRIVAAGLGIYLMSPTEQNWRLQTITQEMEVLRTYGMGYAFFRSRFLTNNTKDIYSFTAEDFNRNLALVPAMTWEKKSPPTPPQTLTIDSLSNTLSWAGAKDLSASPYLTYNVYSSDTYPVDVTKASNLALIRTDKTTVNVLLNGRFYAVTAMDRYGNESDAKQQVGVMVRKEPSKAPQKSYSVPMLECDGKWLKVGTTKINTTDLMQVETLQGKVVKTLFQAKSLDVSDLPEGFYQLRSLGEKEVSHRLGFFKIERKKH